MSSLGDTIPVRNTFVASSAPRRGFLLKRGVDLVGALLGLLVLSPVFLIISVMIKLTDGGKVFYGHKRIGQHGQEFGCLKFRTMVQDGDAVLSEYLDKNPEARDEWLQTRKLQNDPRVTRIGAVLRRLSLDELPQLINILRGQMSIVGPRPVVADELAYYGPHVGCYLTSRPGLTGLWQVSGRDDVSYDTRVAFDRLYVKKRSFWQYLKIVILTCKITFFDKFRRK